MTQQEFTQRTQVEVTYKEYEAIETVYMNCDLDKDEFCKMWCKMNQKRVEKAKADKEAAEKAEALKWELSHIANREYTGEQYGGFVSDVLDVEDQKLISAAGIKLDEEIYNMAINCWYIVPRCLSSVIYDIKKFIKA